MATPGVDATLRAAPLRVARFVTSAVTSVTLADGSILMRSSEPLRDYGHRVGDWLDHWATASPDRPFLVEQTPQAERAISYGEGRRKVFALAAGLLELNLGQDRPLAILASNGVDHGIAMLAALYVGIPVAPIAPAYALQTDDHAKLAHSLALIAPGAVLVEDGERYTKALMAALDPAIPVLAIRNPCVARHMRSLASLECDDPQSVVAAAKQVGRDSVAKYLFTSGSTGMPKAVVNTHGMLCAAAQMQRQVTAFVAEEPPIMVDWLAWNHTAGGNANFNLVLCNGGTLYIDPGRPIAGQMEASVALLRRVSPTLFFNVPMGYEAMLPYLEEDRALRECFFRDLKFLWYAAASMQPSTWRALERLAVETVGQRILIAAGLGMTETGPIALFGNEVATGAGVVGVPAPGVELKLVPHDGKLEARFRGPNVMPGYLRNPVATTAAFDEDGYFRSGDLLSFVDPHRPDLGLRFEGRASEDFKLASGTRVSAGSLRLRALDMLRPFASDVVIVGEGRNDVRMMIFPDRQRCAEAAEAGHDPADDPLLPKSHLRELLLDRLERLASSGTGGSNRIVAAMLMAEPPLASAGELTDKGTINARALQQRRSDLVDILFAAPDGQRLVLPSR